MTAARRVALVGDRSPSVVAHQAIERSLALLSAETDLHWDWLETASLAPDPIAGVAGYDRIWVVPGSPYASTEAVLAVIRHARERGIPFLGTCGGFQHAVLEFARSVLGIPEAAHAETEPGATTQVITPLSCALVEERERVVFTPGSRLGTLMGTASNEEGYHCRYGLNPEFVERLERAGLRVSARDEAGDVRALEFREHPFFLLTLFQPERAALQGSVHGVVRGLVRAG